jgi:ABC-type transport system involved in multi-copper enzyme maturation permease subunit
MSPVVRAELLKLRTTRTFVALVASALALSLLVVGLTTALSNNLTEGDVRELFTADFSGPFILLLGIMGMAGEWRHRTITSTILAAPNRLKLIAAKAISYAIAGVVVSFVVTASLMLVGSIILSSRGETTLDAATLVDIMWRNLVVAAYLGAIGVAVGAILRNQVAAIIGLILFPLVVELTLFGLVPDVARFSPINGVTSGLSNINTDQGSDLDFLDPGVAALVMCGWLSVLFAAGALLLKRRDLT